MQNSNQEPLNQSLTSLTESNKSTDENTPKTPALPVSEPIVLASNPPQPSSPEAKPVQTKPESPARAPRSSYNSNKPSRLSAVVVPTKATQLLRAECDFAADLNRMGNLIKERTRLDATPLQLVFEVIDSSDEIMKEIKDVWYFLASPESYVALGENLNRTIKMQEDLSQIAVVGKVISKFTLDQDRASKLKRHAEALKTYFGRKYLPRDVLKFIWERGGILVAEALSRPESKS